MNIYGPLAAIQDFRFLERDPQKQTFQAYWLADQNLMMFIFNYTLMIFMGLERAYRRRLAFIM